MRWPQRLGLRSALPATSIVLAASISALQAVAPVQLPKDWLQVRATGNVLTFVDTQFEDGGLGERVRSLVEGVRGIEVHPMALRSIFTALARTARDGPA